MDQNATERVLELVRKQDELQRELGRLQGRLEQHLQTLKDDFNCTTVDEARAFLEELGDKVRSLNTKLEKLVQAFDTNYGDKLDGV